MSTQLMGKILNIAYEHNQRRARVRAEEERASRSIDLGETAGAALPMQENATGRQYLGINRNEVEANQAADRDRLKRHAERRRGDGPGDPATAKPFLSGPGFEAPLPGDMLNYKPEDPIAVAMRAAIESEVKRVAMEYERLCEILGIFNDVAQARRLLMLLLETEQGFTV